MSSKAPKITPKTKNQVQETTDAISIAFKSYVSTIGNNSKLKLVDIFLVFLVALGVLQFVFAVVFGTFPFNAFLAGFVSTVGQFVLTVSLRLQYVNGDRGQETMFRNISPQRAFGEYIFASLMLHFTVLHFIN